VAGPAPLSPVATGAAAVVGVAVAWLRVGPDGAATQASASGRGPVGGFRAAGFIGILNNPPPTCLVA
jgi:hypothetical protein